MFFFRLFQNDPGPPKFALELRGYVKYIFFLHFTVHYSQELKVRKVKFRSFKFSSVVFLSPFCFECKIHFKTYGIPHNKNINQKNSLSHGTTKGGGGAGPLCSKRLQKGPFFIEPFPYLHFLEREKSCDLASLIKRTEYTSIIKLM